MAALLQSGIKFLIGGMKRFWRSSDGASAGEYALVLAIVGTGVAISAFNLGSAVSGALNDAASCISATASCP